MELRHGKGDGVRPRQGTGHRLEEIVAVLGGGTVTEQRRTVIDSAIAPESGRLEARGAGRVVVTNADTLTLRPRFHTHSSVQGGQSYGHQVTASAHIG